MPLHTHNDIVGERKIKPKVYLLWICCTNRALDDYRGEFAVGVFFYYVSVERKFSISDAWLKSNLKGGTFSHVAFALVSSTTRCSPVL